MRALRIAMGAVLAAAMLFSVPAEAKRTIKKKAAKVQVEEGPSFIDALMAQIESLSVKVHAKKKVKK